MTYLLLMTFLHLIPLTTLTVILISILISICLMNHRQLPYRLVTAWLVWRLRSNAGAGWWMSGKRPHVSSRR